MSDEPTGLNMMISATELYDLLNQIRGLGTWQEKIQYQISLPYSEGETPGPPFKCASIIITGSYDQSGMPLGSYEVVTTDKRSTEFALKALRGQLQPLKKQKQTKLIAYERAFPVEHMDSGKFCWLKFSEPQHFRIENISAVLSYDGYREEEPVFSEGCRFSLVDVTFSNESQMKLKNEDGIPFGRIFDWTGKLNVVRPDEEVGLVFKNIGSVAAKLHVKIAGQVMVEAGR